MYQMIYAVRDEMAASYPELKESADRVAKVVEAEERQFARVLAQGSLEWDRLIFRQRDENSVKKLKFRTDLKQALQKVYPAVADRFDVGTREMLEINQHFYDVEEAIEKGFPASMAKPLLDEWHQREGVHPSVGAETHSISTKPTASHSIS